MVVRGMTGAFVAPHVAKLDEFGSVKRSLQLPHCAQGHGGAAPVAEGGRGDF
jgi:hypothetical protein